MIKAFIFTSPKFNATIQGDSVEDAKESLLSLHLRRIIYACPHLTGEELEEIRLARTEEIENAGITEIWL